MCFLFLSLSLSLSLFLCLSVHRNTNETLVFNLWTLYELSSTRPAVKKQVIQRIVALFAPEDFDDVSLKV